MAIEALYPYIAVAYGTFGIVFGVLLWWKTQRRIDRTKSAIETQVANAVTDISAKVDEKLGGLEFDMTPMTAKLDGMMEAIPDQISTHIDMHMKAVQAGEAKKVKALLEEMDLEGIAEEKREEIISRLSTKQKAGLKLMTMKIPKAARDANPLAVAVFDEARGIVGQALVDMDESGGSSREGTPSRSGSFRPGYHG